MGIPRTIPEHSSFASAIDTNDFACENEFLQRCRLFFTDMHAIVDKDVRFQKTRDFFHLIGENLVHFQKESFLQLKKVVCEKLREWVSGNIYEQQISDEYSWITEELR
jgi:hypothetical protein